MELREFLDYANEQSASGDDFHRCAAEQLIRYPVSIREFIESPEFLNDTSVYPANMETLEQLNNSDGLRIGSCYTEAVIAGAIGVGKSTIAILSLLYQIYVLSCLRSPQGLFDLSAKSELVFVVQAPTERLAKAVGYSRMREYVLQSPYFNRNHKPDKRVKSELRFPNGIVLRPLSGSDTAALGQNVLGGLLDEIAFADYTERSARTRDREVFDQAERQYNAIAMRRKSRFLKKGRLPGLLCLVSSPQYPDDLIERKIRQADNDPAIFLYQLRLWDVKRGNYGEEWFNVFTGDDNRPPRLLGDSDSSDAELAALERLSVSMIAQGTPCARIATGSERPGRSTPSVHRFSSDPGSAHLAGQAYRSFEATQLAGADFDVKLVADLAKLFRGRLCLLRQIEHSFARDLAFDGLGLNSAA